ncbi:plasmid mobilization protein [Paraburkholderia oxyphila]|uniref:plasmid mobilization protein n=1 Tax=Paraburkholderia oxyphila TaxID=614212 RepID=UPI0004816436|nr:hypothetical protein [Paraburkholderia oxyphila]
MNKPSERIVVFVTPAQKRAISASADELGISISELMRRAVLAFSATSDQVKAASIVDRLNAPREPDVLAQVLRKAAKPLRAGRAAGLRPAVAQPAAADVQVDGEAAVPLASGTISPVPAESGENAAALPASGTGPDTRSPVHELAQAVARLSGEAAQAAEDTEAQEDAVLPEDVHREDAEPLQPRGGTPFAHAARDEEEDAPRNDPAPDAGKFA